MDKGMKKVVNLVTNYMSALCETGRVPGRVDRNFADFAENNELEFYENGICIRHR